MKRRPLTAVGVSVGTLLGLGLVVRGLEGCYSAVANDGLVDAGPPPVSDAKLPDAGADSDFVGPGDAACTTAPGQTPSPTCFGKTLTCSPSPKGTCPIDNATCGEKLCLPMTDNKATAPTYNFRMEQISITAPPSLANETIASLVVDPGVTLDDPSGKCGYGPALPTIGAFSWLLSVDKSTSVVTTGGGSPALDPYKTGYCFVKGSFGDAGIAVAPLPDPVTFTGNTFSSKAPSTGVLNIPIFLGNTSADLLAPVILPIRGSKFTDVGLSKDGNCIGDMNPEWAATAGSSCADAAASQSPIEGLTTGCPKWFTNGSLSGYITLADANAVSTKASIGMGTLCGLLTIGAGKTCTSADLTMGDYCSTSADGKGCTDSVWLAATFAANAVKIYDSKTPPCGE
jgi:hypothetical protein